MSSGREEGEIDSEEDGLRKRIHELENENAEYEKIKRISESYRDKYGITYRLNELNDWEAVQRAGQVPTDASSISSYEFPSKKKKKHKRSKKGKCKLHERRTVQRSHRCTHQRHKHSKRHHQRRERLSNPYYENGGIETISLDTTDNSEYEKDNYSIATMDIGSTDDNDGDITLPLSREELRLALGRGTTERRNNMCSLKERLQPDKFTPLQSAEKVQTLEEAAVNSNDAENVVEINSDNSISIEEQELRLIALRSAIMRKHATRKKRNAEIAYSPTDFDELLVEPVSSVDTDIEELQGDMEISPASSPRLLLSPIQCDDEQNSNISLDTVDNQVDNKPVDMELASSDSEPEDNSKHVISTDILYTHPHTIPLPAGLPMDNGGMTMAYDYTGHGNHMSYDMYMPAMHYSTALELPQPMLPLPPCTYDKLPTYAIPSDDATCVKNEAANELLRASLSPKSLNMEIIQQEDTQEATEHCSDEEEAEALRALLLSQRQMVKNTKTNGVTQMRKQSPTHDARTRTSPKAFEDIKCAENSIKPPTLQQTMPDECNVAKPTPTESILKEAVRRLKVKTFASGENAHARQAMELDLHVPRLKIKSFARCRDVDEANVAHAQTALEAESVANAFKVQTTHVNNAFSKHVERMNDTESVQQKNARESVAQEIATAPAPMPSKRRFESTVVVELPIPIKEAPQIAESLHAIEDSNEMQLQKDQKTPRTFETPTKKLKRTLELPKHAPTAGVQNEPRVKPQATEISANERDSNSSGEKENKEISSAKANKTDNILTQHATKAKAATKPAAKSVKVAPKSKVNATLTPAKNQTTTTTPPPNLSGAPPPRVIKPQAQQLKIVKPNKVINKNLEVQQKTQKTDGSTNLQKKLDANKQQQPSRILTPTTLPNMKVRKLIIHVGDTDSSSEDEEILRNQTLERCIGLATTRTHTPDSLTNVLNENVYGSKAGSTPTEAPAAPNAPTSDDSAHASAAKDGSNVGAAFEKKLENFLKTIRSKTLPTSESAVHAHARVRKLSSSNGAHTRTPTAVRSLPIASQEEYKRLVHRMKILERQKQLKKMQHNLIVDAEKYTKAKQDANTNTNNSVCANSETASNGTLSSNEVHTAEIHSEKSTPHKSLDMTQQPSPQNQLALMAKLRSCETIYTSISNSILTRLEKSLQLVNETRSAKIAKMRHEQHLKQLRHEIEQTQRKLKEEQVKISRIHPQICANNELITKLKQKRAKVLDMAVKLGKSMKGEDYRLNNDLKNEIAHKTKGLATHIKLVNSIKYNDLDSVLDKVTDKSTSAVLSAPTSELSAEKPITTEHNNSKASVANENVEPTSAASDIKAEAAAAAKALVANTNAVDKQKNGEEAYESCDKDCAVMEPAPASVEAAINCIEDAAVKEPEAAVVVEQQQQQQPVPCASGKEVLHVDGEPADEHGTPADSTPTRGDEVVELPPEGCALRDYVSPLLHLRSECGQWDPNDIICPYELMGQCEDKDCSYKHLKMCE